MSVQVLRARKPLACLEAERNNWVKFQGTSGDEDRECVDIGSGPGEGEKCGLVRIRKKELCPQGNKYKDG